MLGGTAVDREHDPQQAGDAGGRKADFAKSGPIAAAPSRSRMFTSDTAVAQAGQVIPGS